MRGGASPGRDLIALSAFVEPHTQDAIEQCGIFTAPVVMHAGGDPDLSVRDRGSDRRERPVEVRGLPFADDGPITLTGLSAPPGR